MQCPICGTKLIQKCDNNGNNILRCCNGHSFDISKYGYVNLLPSKTNSGDNKEMVLARHNFLQKDYYLKLALELKNIINDLNVRTLLDIGCGEGYYDRIINDENIEIYGLDISKEAILKAAKLDKNIQYIVASSNKLPFEDNYFDCVMSIFSPIYPSEAERVCSKYLIKVIPNKDHLKELKQELYENVRDNKILKEEIEGFNLIDEKTIDYKMKVEDVNELFKMTPYFYTTHNNYEIKFREMDISFSFIIRIYKVY